MTNEAPAIEKVADVESFQTFLESVAAGELRSLSLEEFATDDNGWPTLEWPSIQLYCAEPSCSGYRNADPRDARLTFDTSKNQKNAFCNYRCRNCHTLLKLYAVNVLAEFDEDADLVCATARKVGEYPLFGPHLPVGVAELLGTDSEYFLKGHRAESQGLGIAAFAYYRRVVESQRTHIFDEIISAAEHVGAEPGMIERLKHLRQHWRFQQSVEELKGCLPQILLIEGQNPLELLHPVLSDSIHDRTDEEALEIAGEIRLVLINLAERIALAKTQSEELKQAVAKLAARKARRGKPVSGAG
jgi:hypothetical protein